YMSSLLYYSVFLLTHTSPTESYTLSLHDALPICRIAKSVADDMLLNPEKDCAAIVAENPDNSPMHDQKELETLVDQVLQQHQQRSEEHTSELQSRFDLVCRLLLEKKNQTKYEYLS